IAGSSAADGVTVDSIRAEAEPARPIRRVAFLGFGLIGGSIARALRSGGATVELAAWTPTGRGPKAGLVAGALDEASAQPWAAVRGADLVVLASPPPRVLEHPRCLGRPHPAA